MENYFSETPYYKIWCDIITLLSQKCSFISTITPYSFNKIECKREEVTKLYIFNDKKLEIIYGHESRIFYCRLSNLNTGENISWKSSPPTITKFNNFNELEIEMDKWMAFLKTEL